MNETFAWIEGSVVVVDFDTPDFFLFLLSVAVVQFIGENGEIYTADKNFTLPPAVTALTNSTSAYR